MKKKYKISWSITNIFSGSCEEVVKLQAIWTGFASTIAGSTYIASNAEWTLVALIGGGFVDKIVLGCMDFQEIKPEASTDGQPK